MKSRPGIGFIALPLRGEECILQDAYLWVVDDYITLPFLILLFSRSILSAHSLTLPYFLILNSRVLLNTSSKFPLLFSQQNTPKPDLITYHLFIMLPTSIPRVLLAFLVILQTLISVSALPVSTTTTTSANTELEARGVSSHSSGGSSRSNVNNNNSGTNSAGPLNTTTSKLVHPSIQPSLFRWSGYYHRLLNSTTVK